MFTLCVSTQAFKLPDTGQKKCYSSSGSVIACASTGQDGAYTKARGYTDHGDGTVTDNVTGLMWQKCNVGQNYLTCSGYGDAYNWYWASGTYSAKFNPNATAICGSLSLGGHDDWRLPTDKELQTIVNYSIPYPGPTMDAVFNSPRAFYNWSSTTNAGQPDYAFYLDFYYGIVNDFLKDAALLIRCVRGG
jgi:hypothetical protein